ncbi:MAG: hypothetical protein GX075_04740, partial [Firmicutes bacterium]|nr:hypothetical protein [Bacillota bacterium]
MPKYTVIPGELRTHSVILSRIKNALLDHDFSTLIIFPTLSLLKAVQAELLNEPDIGGVGGIRFLLFEGFLEELIRRFGLEGRRPAPLEQELLITEAFFNLNQAGEFDYLNQAPFSAGYRRALLEGIREWKRAGLTPEIFKEWAGGQSAKEQELALVYEEYQRLLIERGLYEEDRLLNFLEELRVKAGEMPETTPLLLYGFTDLTPLQSDYLKILEFWFEIEFLIDPTSAPEFQRIVSGQFGIKLPASGPRNPSKNILEELQNNFWTQKPVANTLNPDDLSLRMIQAAGPVREATAIAREIIKLISENPGYREEDFLIITPNYREFIKIAGPVFKQYGIGIEGKSGRNAVEYPTVNRFYEVLTACETDWQWPEMELLIRHYYSDADASSGDRLLLWIGRCYGGVSSRRRWLELIEDQRFGQKAAEEGLDLKPLLMMIEWLKKIPERAFLKDYLELALEWFKAHRFYGAGRFSEDPEILALEVENIRAAQACIGTLEEIGRALVGLSCFQAELSLAEFRRFISECWSELTVERVAVHGSRTLKILPPQEARGLRAPVVFIAGLEQGVFPRAYVNDWKLSPAARRELGTLGIDLETGEGYWLQEELAFYWSLQTARERLYLVYCDQDEGGQPQNRSIFLDEVLQWVPELEERAIKYGLAPRVPGFRNDCYSAAEINEWLVTVLLKPEAQIGPEEMEQLRLALADLKRRRLVKRLRDWRQAGLWKGLAADQKIIQLLNGEFGEDHCYSITAIEDYRSCPYRFFLKYVIKIKPAPKPTLLPELLDMGLLYHAILREFGKKVRGRSLSREEKDRYWELLSGLIEDQYQEWRKWSGSQPAEMILSLKLEEIRKTLQRWLESELDWAEATAGRFKFDRFEWSFGTGGDLSGPETLAAPYRLEDQIVVKIGGRVDRVDRDQSGKFTVYDYKLGRGPTAKDLLELEDLQIPVYLMALEQLHFGPGQAVGGSYLGLRNPSRGNGGIWNRERLGPVLKGKGLLDQEGWEALLEGVRQQIIAAVVGIRSGDFGLTEGDCLKYCEYRDCCRRLEREVEGNGISS